MNTLKNSDLIHSIFTLIGNFIMFFLMIAFVVTCSFCLQVTSINMSENHIRTFAPIVFINVLALTIIFVILDYVRRKITVDRPVQEIQETLEQLMAGNFEARISVSHLGPKQHHFGDIAESINSLATELASVETLRTDFIANVSHELKTPLAVMQNYGTMLQQPGLSEKERLEYAKAITDTSRRLASLITNILKLNKLENQQIFPAVDKYDLGEQLCECLLQFEDVWERKNLEIETEMEEDVWIRSDAELLSLVWNNLISNAVKFTPTGGRISVGLKTDGDQVVVTVSDTGCGIKSEIGTHIFEKFYQGDTSHATQGNGLGLALVKRVVDIIKGEIDVESVYGKGSTFTVKIRKQ